LLSFSYLGLLFSTYCSLVEICGLSIVPLNWESCNLGLILKGGDAVRSLLLEPKVCDSGRVY
jgi:hypothetical protein